MFREQVFISITRFFGSRRGRVVMIGLIALFAVIPLFFTVAGTALEAVSVSAILAVLIAFFVAIPLGLPRFLTWCGFYARLHQTLTPGPIFQIPDDEDVRTLAARINPAVEGEVLANVGVTLRYHLFLGRHYDERVTAPAPWWSIEIERVVTISLPLLAEMSYRINTTLTDEQQMASFQRLARQTNNINNARHMPNLVQDTVQVALHHFRYRVWTGNSFLSGNGPDLRV
jgi:hypothetical protein